MADKLLAFVNKSRQPTATVYKSPKLTERHIDGLQYLSGYIIWNLLKTAKKHSQSWNKLYYVNTNAFTIDNFSEQTLVQPKTRVGLVAVSNTVPRTFIMAGEIFRICGGTRDSKNGYYCYDWVSCDKYWGEKHFHCCGRFSPQYHWRNQSERVSRNLKFVFLSKVVFLCKRQNTSVLLLVKK